MSVNAKISKNLSVGGVTFPENKTIVGDAAIVHDEQVPAGDPGVLSVRGGDTSGTIDIDDSGHTITDADRVDLYWDGGCRRGMTVGTVAGASVPVSGGAGDALPALSTPITVARPVELQLVVSGSLVQAILFFTDTHGQFVLEDAGGEELFKEVNEDATWSWHNDSGEDNPITGDSIVKAFVSHDGTEVGTMRVGVLHNNS